MVDNTKEFNLFSDQRASQPGLRFDVLWEQRISALPDRHWHPGGRQPFQRRGNSALSAGQSDLGRTEAFVGGRAAGPDGTRRNVRRTRFQSMKRMQPIRWGHIRIFFSGMRSALCGRIPEERIISSLSCWKTDRNGGGSHEIPASLSRLPQKGNPALPSPFPL